MKRKRMILVTACLAGAVGLAALASFMAAPGRVRPSALAEVGGTPVTEAAFRYWWERDPPPSDTGEARQAVLDKLVERTDLVNRARAAGLDRDPAVVEAIESLLIARLKETELQPALAALEVADDEARTDYESHPDRYVVPEQRRVAVLWFDTRGLEPLAARYRPRLEAIREQFFDGSTTPPPGEGFGSLALENSEHRASRHRGGDLGWLGQRSDPDPWRSAVTEIANRLDAPGALSEVVTNQQGVFLIRLIDHRPAARKTFEAVRPQIVDNLLRAKRARLQADYSERPDAAGVTIHHDRLSALQGLPVVPGVTTDDPPFDISFQTDQ